MLLKQRTRCSQKLQEHLQELSRKEDLEGLRGPLRDLELFPADKDPNVAPITMEELKKLVRHWKLHETRGFWKMHPTKEDLVSALLEYVDADALRKEDFTGSAASRKSPTRPNSGKPSRLRRRRQSNVDLTTFRVNCLKPYAGDLFSTRDCTEGLIYLSRQSIKNPGTAKASTQNTNKKRGHGGNAFLAPEFLTTTTTTTKNAVLDNDKGGTSLSFAATTPQTLSITEEQVVVGERQRRQWRAIALEIFRYSIDSGDEPDMIDEGALEVIEKITKSDQASASLANLDMATYCVGTLVNLACGTVSGGVFPRKDETRSLLMPPGQMILVDAVNVVTTHHSSEPTAMLLCVLSVLYLSCTWGDEDALLSTTISVLGTACAVDSSDCKEASLACLVNLFPSTERNQLVEHVLPVLKSLAAANELEAALLATVAIYDLSFYDVPRAALVENGCITLIAGLFNTLEASQHHHKTAGGRQEKTTTKENSASTALSSSEGEKLLVKGDDDDDDKDAGREEVLSKKKEGSVDVDAAGAFHCIAESLLNLSCTADMRERMIKDGAVSVLVDLDASTRSRGTKEVLALALSNLTSPEVAYLLPVFVEQGGLPSLVTLARLVSTDEARFRLAVALSHLTTEPAYRELMVQCRSHEALLHLSISAGADAPCQAFIIVAFVNLLSLPQNQLAIVDAGLLPFLRRLYDAEVAQNDKARRAASQAASDQAQKRRSRRGSASLKVYQPGMPNTPVPVVTTTTSPVSVSPSAALVVCEDIKRYCGMALANIADDLSLHETATHKIVIDMMTDLAKGDAQTDLLRVVASAFAMFAYIMTVDDDDSSDVEKKNDSEDGNKNVGASALPPPPKKKKEKTSQQKLLTKEVIETILGLCGSKDSTVLKFAGIALNNLSQTELFHEALFENGVAEALLFLGSSREDEVRRVCASTVHSLTSSNALESCSVATARGVVKVLEALEKSRAPDIVNFCAATLFSLSCCQAHCGLLTKEAPILRRLFGMMRGGQESTQLYAARALCNLTCDEACVTTLLRERAVADFIAIAILRTNNEEVKGVCAQCLFNVIRYDATRLQLLKEPHNVLWAISRLFRFCVDSERTQTIGALVVYNLSCDDDAAATLMTTINAAETLAAVALHPETQPKCWAAAALCNLSWSRDFAAQLVADAAATNNRPVTADTNGKGIIRVLRTLVEADLLDDDIKDPNANAKGTTTTKKNKAATFITTKCATALHNISHCDPEVRERLVDDGVTVLIESLLESPTADVVELACVVCYNISLVPGCEAALVDYQVANSLIKLLMTIVLDEKNENGKEKKKKSPSSAAKKNLEGENDDDEEQDEEEDSSSGAFPVDRGETLLLILGNLYNLTIRPESRAPLEAAGATDACIAVARLRDAPLVHVETVTATLQNLSWEADNHRSWLQKGNRFVASLATMASREDVSFGALRDIATVAANLSTSVDLGEALVDIGTVDVVALVVTLADRRADAHEKDTLLDLAAAAARNLSTIKQGEDNLLHPAWRQPLIEPTMQALARQRPRDHQEGFSSSVSRLGDVVATLYNILINNGSADLATADSLTAILTALFPRCESPATRSLCAAALIARQGEKDSAHFSDGSVQALRSAMQADIAAYDASAVATPRPLKADKPLKADEREPKPGIARLGPHFASINNDAIVSTKVQRNLEAPQWTSFTQDAHALSQGLEAPATQTVKLPKQPADPPKCPNTKTRGTFRKINLLPTKVRSVAATSSSATRQGSSTRDIDNDETNLRVPLRFDFRDLFPAVPVADATPP